MGVVPSYQPGPSASSSGEPGTPACWPVDPIVGSAGSVADSIDTRTAAGRLVLNVLLSVAQWERETIAERTRDALQHKIRTGQRCGRIRFGYDLASDGATLVANEQQQQALGMVRELKAAGLSLREIAAELTRRGVATKEGKAAWTHTAVNRILQSQLVGVSPYDPLTMTSAPVILFVVAMLACQIPARRAMRVDPVLALRQD